MSPTQMVILQDAFTEVKVQYRQDINPVDMSFAPPLSYASFVNNNLNIMILQYETATNTLDLHLNGVKHTINFDFDNVNFRYFGFCGGVSGNFEGLASPGWNYTNNILECGFCNLYYGDVQAGNLNSMLSGFYNNLANFGTPDNYVLKYNSGTQLWEQEADNAHTHLVADITDFPATMPPDAHTHTLNASLTDVVVNNPSVYGEILWRDSTNWTNSYNAVVWKDLLGQVNVRTGGQANAPTIQAFDSNSIFYEYATASAGLTDIYFTFHPNHDMDLSKDMYFHIHHATNNVGNNNATVEWTVSVSSAQLAYSGLLPPNSKFFQEGGGYTTLATVSHTYDNACQYRHVVTEVPLAVNGGGANVLDSSKINIDSLILVRVRRNAGAGGDNATNNYVFVLGCDIHYQAVRVGSRLRIQDAQYNFL